MSLQPLKKQRFAREFQTSFRWYIKPTLLSSIFPRIVSFSEQHLDSSFQKVDRISLHHNRRKALILYSNFLDSVFYLLLRSCRVLIRYPSSTCASTGSTNPAPSGTPTLKSLRHSQRRLIFGGPALAAPYIPCSITTASFIFYVSSTTQDLPPIRYRQAFDQNKNSCKRCRY